MKKIEMQVKLLTSEKRYRHSLAVRDEAGNLAEFYGADAEKARLAGLIHDCVKCIEYDKMEEMAKSMGIYLDEITLAEKKLMHAHVGAYYTKKYMGIDDDEVFDAVYYHTTGKANMGIITKIIYIADFIEPNRSYEQAEYLRKLAYVDLDATVLEGLNFTINKMMGSGKMLHPDTVNARNYLIMERGAGNEYRISEKNCKNAVG